MRWSAAEDDFLRRYYPDHGFKATLKEHNRLYPERSYRAIVDRVLFLGLRLSEERYRQKQIETGRNYCQKEVKPIGFVNTDNGMIKTTDGWKRLGAILNTPKGKYTVHLNGDKGDNSPENLAVIDKRTSMKMTIYGFWTENKELTKAGILACELENAINDTTTS